MPLEILRIIHKISRMDPEESSQEKATLVRHVGAGPGLELGEVGETDTLPQLFPNELAHLCLRQRAGKPPTHPFNFPPYSQLFAQSHGQSLVKLAISNTLINIVQIANLVKRKMIKQVSAYFSISCAMLAMNRNRSGERRLEDWKKAQQRRSGPQRTGRENQDGNKPDQMGIVSCPN